MIGLGTLLVPLDTTVNVAFPHIVARFGIAIPAIKWVVICYVGVHASLMLVCGRLGDLFGYRRIFLIGCAWSAGAFVLCATAQSYAWLLASRALQGVGAALVLSVGAALATAAYAPEARARVLGLYTMMFAIGAALGPPLAGVLIARWGWSAVYAFRVPLALAGFALAWLLPPGRPSGQARFDVLGGVLMVAATGFLLLGLDEIQAMGALLLPYLALAALAGWGFIRVQRRRADPLIALRHFANPGLSLALATATALNLVTFAILLLGPFLLARAASLTPMQSGAMLAASPLGMMLAAPLAGRLAATIGTRRLGRVGLAVTTLGLGALGLVAAPLDLALVAGAMFIQGIGQGLFQVANFDVVTSALPAADRGVAGSLALLTRTLGLMLGATLLMLASAAFTRWAALSLPAEEAFIAGIALTFRLAAAVALALLAIDLLVRTSRRSPPAPPAPPAPGSPARSRGPAPRRRASGRG